jgi:hypothetical protein
MTVADLKARYAKKMKVDEKNLVCLLKTQNDKVEFLQDSRKLYDIEHSKYYTMIYEVAEPEEEDQVMLEFHFYEEKKHKMKNREKEIVPVEKQVLRFEKVNK